MSVHPVPFTLAEGKEIKISGLANSDASRFSINLCAEENFDNDTPLHFNPRFDGPEVVRNHFDGSWGEEETCGEFPFVQGEPYEVKIRVKDYSYVIIVNGSELCEFSHRLPKEYVRNVYIEGDTEVNFVTFHETARPIPFDLSDGKEVIVRGVPSPDVDRFSINLCSGEDFDNTDVVLHFNPRFEDGHVIRNSSDGGWGEEETEGGFPFQQGVPYELKIATWGPQFRIYVNGNHFCDFNHRTSPHQARYVVVDGETTVHDISFHDNSPIMNPDVPFTTKIPGEFQPGRRIHVRARPTEAPSRFNINLVCGDSFDDDDVAFHFDARFDYGDYQNEVVRTVKLGGEWGDEERDGYFPFNPSEEFNLRLFVSSESYTIEVNGSFICSFEHKMEPLERVRYLNIQGDIDLHSVHFE